MTFRKFDKGDLERPKGVTNDCQVRALATATDISWNAAWAMLYERQGIRKYCHFELLNSLKEMEDDTFSLIDGISFLHFDVVDVISGQPKKGQKRMTVKDFCMKYKKGRYIVQVANHVVAVKNGVFYDTHDCSHSCVYKAWEVEVC